VTASLDTGTYFAAKPPEEIGASIFDRIRRNTEVRRGGERYDAQLAGYNHYYGYDFGQGVTWRIDRDGDVGELASIRINKARTVARSLVGLLTAAPLSWDVKARNGTGDARSLVQKAANILEYYWEVQGYQSKCNQGVESAVVAAECFGFMRWDRQRGKALMPAPRQPHPGEDPEKAPKQTMLHEGDTDLHLVMPWDAHWDEDYRAFKDSPWICVRVYLPKWDMLEEYPTDITGRPATDAIKSARPQVALPTGYSRQLTGIEGDAIGVYFFFHRDTLSVPGGRETILISPECVLKDGPLEYPEVPIKRLVLEEQLDSTRGYSSWWDTLGIQELTDSLQTSIASNQSALATQSIAMEEGSKANIDAVSGLKTFYYKPGGKPPAALQLTSTPKEVFEHVAEMGATQKDMVGLNDVVQGQPDTAQMNAEAFNILVSMALQRNSPAQKQVLQWVGDLGKLQLKILEKFATTERQVAIAGDEAEATVTEVKFQGSDLSAIDSVLVTVGNALEQSPVGRLQVLNTLVKVPGVMMNVRDAAQVIETGRLEPVLDPARALELAIAKENSMLHKAQPPPVLFSDDHLAHCRAHAIVVEYADVRGNQQVLAAWKTHLNQHYVEFFGLPPGMAPEQDPQYPIRLRLLLGQQPPPVAVPPGAPGPQPASAGPSPAAHAQPPNAKPGGPPPAMQPPSGVPQLPKSPAAGGPVQAPPGVPHAA